MVNVVFLFTPVRDTCDLCGAHRDSVQIRGGNGAPFRFFLLCEYLCTVTFRHVTCTTPCQGLYLPSQGIDKLAGGADVPGVL